MFQSYRYLNFHVVATLNLRIVILSSAMSLLICFVGFTFLRIRVLDFLGLTLYRESVICFNSSCVSKLVRHMNDDVRINYTPRINLNVRVIK